ncbi:head-tail connector protein [Paenibacillus dokdonensis]|uniref:Head-tail connector protein n=1 Tax=Paenibacillus dokdonensis TaxID=2567944 RepID=A0ABU6GWL3_9BACL|nr:head-tail connector protein [Paenibacillus dokdonensis]MEC0242771.1 head-tail connector protein [Paenibacillus dokdonensis]
MVDLALLKSYLRIDGSEDDTVLALLLDAAKEYLHNAGVPEPEQGVESKLYDLAVMLRVHRERARDEKEVERVEKSLTSIILQLKTGYLKG